MLKRRAGREVAARRCVGALETDLAQSIAENRWRLRRICATEAGIFADGRGDAMLSPREDAEQLAIDEAVAKARTWLFKADKLQPERQAAQDRPLVGPASRTRLACCISQIYTGWCGGTRRSHRRLFRL